MPCVSRSIRWPRHLPAPAAVDCGRCGPLSGNRTSRQHLLTGATENYNYDALYEVRQVTQAANIMESYGYDPAGNRLTSLLGPYSYNSSNELTALATNSYTYDKNGNMLSKTIGASVTGYAWDWENRLSSITLPNNGGTVSFRYYPFGRRIQKTSASGVTNYLYDGANIVAEVSSSRYSSGSPNAWRAAAWLGWQGGCASAIELPHSSQ
jgi:uncharacterized protein RhaS with RHS repeats